MRILAAIGLIALVGAIAAGVFFFGGFYNIAASEPDLDIVRWALFQVRTASIEHYAVDRSPAGLADPAMIQNGARVRNDRMRQLPRRARRQMGQVFRRVASRPA